MQIKHYWSCAQYEKFSLLNKSYETCNVNIMVIIVKILFYMGSDCIIFKG